MKRLNIQVEATLLYTASDTLLLNEFKPSPVNLRGFAPSASGLFAASQMNDARNSTITRYNIARAHLIATRLDRHN